MTADARVSADESQQSVGGAGEGSAGPQQSGEDEAVRSFAYLPPGNGATPRPSTPDGAMATDPALADEPDQAPADAADAADAAQAGHAPADADDGPAPDDHADEGPALDDGADDGPDLDGRADGRALDGRADDGRALDGRADDGRALDGRADDDGAALADPASADGRADTGVPPDARDSADVDQAPDGRADDGATMADHAVPDGYVDDGVAPADRAVADALDEAPDGRADDDGMAQANAAAPDDGVALDDASGGRADDDGMALAADGRVDVEGGEVEDESAPVDDPWIRSDGAPGAGDLVEDDVVAAEVAGQLGTVVGEEADADPAEFAAAAVLDVLRASGWADVAEATELRAEAARLRELLAEVIRDHRAREASMAGFENQQLHWLVPLLRAAHGVAFGSLGAKVALRTAVQEVPPEVLASAGLRIDYGVPPDQEDDR